MGTCSQCVIEIWRLYTRLQTNQTRLGWPQLRTVWIFPGWPWLSEGCSVKAKVVVYHWKYYGGQLGKPFSGQMVLWCVYCILWHNRAHNYEFWYSAYWVRIKLRENHIKAEFRWIIIMKIVKSAIFNSSWLWGWWSWMKLLPYGPIYRGSPEFGTEFKWRPSEKSSIIPHKRNSKLYANILIIECLQA